MLKNKKLIAVTAILFAALLGGGIPVFSKVALEELSPNLVVFFRTLIASLILGPFVIHAKPKLDKDVWKLLGVSILAVMNVTLFAIGVKNTNATVSQLLYSSVPVISAAFAFIFFGTKLSSKKILGLILGFVGVIIIIVVPAILYAENENVTLWGTLIVFSAVLSFTFYALFSKDLQKKYSPLLLTFTFTLLASFVQLLVSIPQLIDDTSLVFNLEPVTYFALFYIGFFGTALYYFLYQIGIKLGNPVIASVTLYIQPIATYIWGTMFLDESLNIFTVIGGILSVVGAYLIVWENNRKKRDSNS